MDPLNPLRDAREMADRLPDPPYVHGDHAATCKGEFGWGCEECNPSEDDEARVPVCWRCEWVAAECVCPEGPQTQRGQLRLYRHLPRRTA